MFMANIKMDNITCLIHRSMVHKLSPNLTPPTPSMAPSLCTNRKPLTVCPFHFAISKMLSKSGWVLRTKEYAQMCSKDYSKPTKHKKKQHLQGCFAINQLILPLSVSGCLPFTSSQHEQYNTVVFKRKMRERMMPIFST